MSPKAEFKHVHLGPFSACCHLTSYFPPHLECTFDSQLAPLERSATRRSGASVASQPHLRMWGASGVNEVTGLRGVFFYRPIVFAGLDCMDKPVSIYDRGKTGRYTDSKFWPS